MRPDAVVVSLDGRNAYDSMSRAVFLSALNSCAPELVPFVGMWYGDPSTYLWWDAAGNCREVSQGEGCEQGDPLAPALYALGQHGALSSAASALAPSESPSPSSTTSTSSPIGIVPGSAAMWWSTVLRTSAASRPM